jgi:CheY-like chemotaxis protein/anti-sigma regulatory factor (Ser/Thr protein kinase)
VAHDFNNLLTPIVGGLDLLRRRLGEDPKSLRYIDAASQSAERARLLVARLLSYSRRQPLAPRNIDLAEMLDGLMDLLERSTGPAISFDVRCAQDLPPAFADAGQLELAILNLVINARDAMPEGGLIVIEAMLREADEGLKLEPGSYIALSVSDQGTGMDDATLRNAIEPFFTTKPVERGTGLGLSMVHGFAAQSGGVLDLSSVVGEGTRVTIWLPKGRSSASKSQRIGGKETTAALPGGGAAIMLVDDEADVRSIAAESLISAGYSVIEAGSVREAVEALEKGALVDLVVTDYLMPGGTGARLVNRVRSDWPHIPIIVLSGYMENAVDLDPSISRLAKPYAIGELLNAIRLALGTAVDDTNSAC